MPFHRDFLESAICECVLVYMYVNNNQQPLCHAHSLVICIVIAHVKHFKLQLHARLELLCLSVVVELLIGLLLGLLDFLIGSLLDLLIGRLFDLPVG